MRPLFHPSMDDVTVEAILHALSDPVRAAIFANIASSNSAQTCSTFLKVSDQTVPKSTLSQHFKALREAGLIRGERRGVQMQNVSRCQEIQRRFPGLIMAIMNAHRIQMEEEKRNAPKKKSRGAGRKTNRAARPERRQAGL